jgi:hypothetical protein
MVFMTEAVMPMRSWLGIVVELTDNVSFRPNDELAVSAVDSGPAELVPELCEDDAVVIAEEDAPFDGRGYSMAVAAETAITATMRMTNTVGVPNALRFEFSFFPASWWLRLGIYFYS